ncbi:MAG: type III-A CRISPR-associated protein Cas10/Csm1, partial [Clostridia bacterium]|nr:type III-A CRISPR-associated protein Cas10/Csm1 [Clostridia bacterium]
YRVNLIYSGGGRAHLLLPNDGVCIGRAEETVSLVNRFLMSRFGTSLFLARGCAEATANELSSVLGEGDSFPDVFRTASSVISRQKLQRYNAEEISAINRKQETHSTDRECVICGRSGRLIAHGDKDEMICETCASLEAFSNTLTKSEFLLAVRKVRHENAIPLPGDMWLECVDRKSLQADRVDTDDIVRIYSINSRCLDIPKTINLRFGNYQPWNDNGSSMTFEQLADASRGVKRLGVLRADVDNLGALFAAGFVDHEDAHPYRYTTLPRYMALSAALTAFFQQEINRIVEESGKSWLPDAEPSKQRRVSIVYSGGDDVFLIGAWNEVLDAGLTLQSAFRRYTGGSVTLSAGLGIFPPHEPVGVMANVTADLEEAAKLIGDGEKNAIALFGPVSSGGASPVFHWDDLRSKVLSDKIPLLHRVFSGYSDEEQANGNAFLYQVLSLLREVQKEPIAIARLAYALARHAPDKKRVPPEQAENYDEFSRNVYRWAMEPEENEALQAAILLHVYAHRKEHDSDVQ